MENPSVTFQSNPDDAAEFGKHYHGYSKAAKSQRLLWTAKFIVFVFIVGTIANYTKNGITTSNLIGQIAVSILAGLLFFVFLLVDAKWFVKKRVSKMLAKGNNQPLTEIHKIQLESDGISIKSESSEGKIGLANIEKIEITDNFVFIYIGAFNAICIRKSSLLEGNLESFTQILQEKWEKPQ